MKVLSSVWIFFLKVIITASILVAGLRTVWRWHISMAEKTPADRARVLVREWVGSPWQLDPEEAYWLVFGRSLMLGPENQDVVLECLDVWVKMGGKTPYKHSEQKDSSD